MDQPSHQRCRPSRYAAAALASQAAAITGDAGPVASRAAGATFANVLKVTVFLVDVNDRVKINKVRQEYFGSARPASTLIGVRELALPGVKVEIEAIVGLE